MAWARWLVQHATTVLIGVLTVLFFGVSAYITLPRESTPDIKIPVVMISTPYIGVSPEDIESLVTVPMERNLKDLKDVDKMTSTSMEGASLVVLEFSPDVNIEDALQKVREKVDAAENDLPEDAEDAQVIEISFSDIPILMVALTGPIDEEALKELGEDVAEERETIPGVLDVKVSGGLTRELKVYANPDRMALYEVSFGDIINALRSENVNIPGGNVDADTSNSLLRIPADLESADDIAGVPVKNVGDQTVFVRDVARVVDGYAERATYSRMNGTPSISLAIQKRVGENIIDIATESRIIVAAASEDWPEGVEYGLLADQSREIENMVGELENNILTGLILVVAVVLLFMGFRNSWFVGLAIPLSMFVSFMVIQAMGMTLNMVVLFSLILALGMLVDNAIVIVENIYRHVEEGKSLADASVTGVSEVAVPVATSTLTTVLAFAPMLFWEGIMGEFMGFLPRTLIIVLTSSLVVALLVIPTATSRWMKVSKVDGTPPEERTGLYGVMMRTYKTILEWSIDHRYISLSMGGLALIGTFVIYGALNHGTEFFPETEPNRAIVQVSAPHGTNIEATDEVARRIEQVILAEPDVDTVITEVGVGSGGDGFGFGSSSTPHSARITVDFKPSVNKAREGEVPRVGSTYAIIDRVRESSTDAVGIDIAVDKIQEGPPVGLPISVEITGDDFHELGRLAADFRRQLRGVPGVVDISDDYKVGRPEMRFTVDRGAAKRVGANTSSVATTLRTAVAGSKASVLREGADEYDITVELDPAYKHDISSVLSLRVPGKDNFMVPLSTLASWDARGGSGSIKHQDREKVVTVSADISEGVPVFAAQQQVIGMIDAWDLPDGYEAGMGGANAEEADAAAFLMRAFLIAICLIFLVLVTQFNSVTRPFIILASVVLSLIGVLWGLLITGTPFGIMMTGIGVISLAGVVVNNAIVLLDYVELVREREGLDVREALVKAGLVRFRPVILTAITTVLGLIPMATGISVDFRGMSIIIGGDSAQFWGPMAVAVCFGLVVATVLTLVMVPTMYSITEDFNSLIQRLRGKPTPAIVAASLALFAVSMPAEAVTLDEAMEAAEENSLDLRMVEENWIQADANVDMAWSTLSPKLSGQANYTYNKDSIEFSFDPSEFLGDDFPVDLDPVDPTVIQQKQYYDANVSVSQTLFSAPALPMLKGAKTLRTAAGHNVDDARAQVRHMATQAYYNLAVRREALVIAEDSLMNARDQLDLATRRVEAGAEPPLTAKQAELSLKRAERQKAQAEEDLVAAEQLFAIVTGLSPDSSVQLPNEPLVDIDTLEEAIGDIDGRADIQAAQARVAASRYQVRADQFGWMPTVSSRFTYSWTQNEGFSGDPEWWMVTVNASWTAWDGGYRLATTKSYNSQLRQAEYAEQKARLEAGQQVQVAWMRYAQAKATYEAGVEELALAEETLRLAELGFTAGTNSWLDVQDTQMMLNQARLGLLSSRMMRDLAAVELEMATGRY